MIERGKARKRKPDVTRDGGQRERERERERGGGCSEGGEKKLIENGPGAVAARRISGLPANEKTFQLSMFFSSATFFRAATN